MTRQQKLGLSLPIAFLVAIAAMALFSRSGVNAAASPGASTSPPPALVALVAAPILEVDSTTLTTYLPTTATAGHDIEPDVESRGVDLDGRLRKPSALGMHLAGNPIGPFAPGSHEVGGVSLMTGGVTQHDVDLAFPADGPRWVIGRSYNSRQNGGSSDSNGPQGKNWFQTAQPEIVVDSNRIYLYYGADRFIEFKLVSGSSTTYRAINGAAGAIEYATNEELDNPIDTYTYTDQASWQWSFIGFGKGGVAAGQIWKIEAPSGEVAYVGDADLANDPVTLGYNGSGYITEAFDSEDRRYTFTYGTHDSVVRLDSVEVETKNGGTWASPTGLETLGLVEYDYYSSETYGDPGDLKVVTITTRLNDDGNELVREKYYRYWEGTFNASTNPGYPHCLQYVYDFEGVRRYDWTDSTFDQDYIGESSANLASFASAYFEYDSSRRCSELTANGGCGSCGGGSSHGTSLFTYEANGSFSGTSGYDTAWARRALVERADGSFVTQYFDEVGQPLSSLITDATPATGTPSKWVTEVQRNSDGVTTQVATPAAITAYTHSTGSVTSSNSAGLIRYWTLETTGATKGFVTEQKYNRDKDSSKYFEWSRTLETGSLTVGDTTVYRPIVDDTRDYPAAITSGTSGSNLTARATTWHTGTLSVKQVTVTWPAVSASNNGSATSDTSRQYLDEVGRVVWTKAEDDIIDYTEYAGGVVVRTIRDADTSETGSGEAFENVTIPSGWSSTAGAFHRIVDYSYDDGFSRTMTERAGAGDERNQISYKTVLADRRLISVNYLDKASTTYYGPVSFQVTNQAGRSEATGRLALSGGTTTTAPSGQIDEADSDPLLAFNVGTVCRYSTSLYDNAGIELAYSRSYFDIPASGAGTDGTNYDAVAFDYDSMGRQDRRLEPHGTIYATTHDVLGRVTQTKVGTDDSGTGSDNMVATKLLEYDDGADDGNSLLTTRTLRTTASSTGERVTDYTYDLRGNLLLTDAPTAPHTLVKYDNLGRELARGEYGGTAPSATTDPESLATNRLALSSQAYDERGRVCQSYFYNIDPVDGSNDGSLRTDRWYDAAGRTVKFEGATLTKSAFDRIGRQTHSFVLAQDNDSRSYAAADDVTGDIVLVESQTVYAATDNNDVVMTASIERFHDDYGGSPTTGALDTNADADALKYTAANIEGRIQINASWFDRFGRMVDRVQYGTYGGSTFDRSTMSSPPARSNEALRTTVAFDDNGKRYSSTDPKGIEDRWGFDDLGRQSWYARNYEDEVPDPGEPDKDQIVRYGYTDGLRTTYIADVVGTPDQVTTYYYGTVGGGSTGDSDIATGHLLHQVAYPDSTGASDRMTYAYNAQGQEVYRLDQDGTVLVKGYDASGRLTSDVASTLGTNIDGRGIGTDIDGAVRRKEFAYDGLGRMSIATQYDATTSGNVVDQFVYTYGEWGQITGFASDVDSAVGASGIAAHEVEIDYSASWAAGAPTTNSGARLIIPTSMTMPTGYVYDYMQDSTGYHQAAGRTNAVEHSDTTVATFDFVGAQRVSRVALTTHDFVMDYADGASGGSYADWDRFNRVVEDEWVKDLATDRTFLQRGYTLDRGGFITEVYDYIEKDTSAVRQMDTLLTLDELDRLTDLQRGTLSGGSISNETMEWNRALDAVGNITDDLLDWNNDGDGLDTDEHDKDLTFTAANEIDDIDTDDVIYSKSGMLLDEPRLKFVYDAWGRTVEVINASGPATLAYYRRNALDHLIGEQLDREPDADIDANDYWEYFLCRPSDMGILASFRGSDPDALVERLWLGDLSVSGAGGFDASALLEVRDDDYDGTADRDTVLFIDRTGSVMAHYGDDGSNGRQVERVFYDMNGAPFLMPWGDVDGDGDADSTDANWISFLWSFSIYDVRADLDLDGDVDSGDVAAHITNSGGTTLSNGGNPIGAQALHSRFGQSYAWMRVQSQTLGMFLTRDPLGYIDGTSLYAFANSNRLAYHDRFGLSSLSSTSGTVGCVANLPHEGPGGTTSFKPASGPDRAFIGPPSPSPSTGKDIYLGCTIRFVGAAPITGTSSCGGGSCMWEFDLTCQPQIVNDGRDDSDKRPYRQIPKKSKEYQDFHGQNDEGESNCSVGVNGGASGGGYAMSGGNFNDWDKSSFKGAQGVRVVSLCPESGSNCMTLEFKMTTTASTAELTASISFCCTCMQAQTPPLIIGGG